MVFRNARLTTEWQWDLCRSVILKLGHQGVLTGIAGGTRGGFQSSIEVLFKMNILFFFYRRQLQSCHITVVWAKPNNLWSHFSYFILYIFLYYVIYIVRIYIIFMMISTVCVSPVGLSLFRRLYLWRLEPILTWRLLEIIWPWTLFLDLVSSNWVVVFSKF